ncbi:hypothetical protein MesoLjLa_63300 (plasmid) [Mesorhizobium sp. L-2-11]|nr:hypothetical protein MesoLjLa_63300 [Mesorhizobium sp. L-2-11]
MRAVTPGSLCRQGAAPTSHAGTDIRAAFGVCHAFNCRGRDRIRTVMRYLFMGAALIENP